VWSRAPSGSDVRVLVATVVHHPDDSRILHRQISSLLSAGHACVDSYTGELLERSLELNIPLWMLWGRKDGLVPSVHARAFQSAHPEAEVHILEECGHYPHIELPQRFNTLLRGWLDATAVPARRRRRGRAAA